MEDFYINSTSRNQSYDYSNITSDYFVYSDITFKYYDVERVDFIIHVVTCIIVGIGLPLTFMAIYALYSLVRSDHVAPIYVINLLISDLLQLISMIVEVAQHVPNKAIHIYYFSLFASVCFMVCIALGRYLVIAHPLWYRFRRTIKTSVAVCVLVWAIPLVYFLTLHVCHVYVLESILFAVIFLLPFPLLIFFLVGTLRALSASISVPSDEKRRIVGILVLVLLIYTLLFLPTIICYLGVFDYDEHLLFLPFIFVRLSPLADLVLYVFMRKGVIDKLLASVCCCRIDSKDISSPSV